MQRGKNCNSTHLTLLDVKLLAACHEKELQFFLLNMHSVGEQEMGILVAIKQDLELSTYNLTTGVGKNRDWSKLAVDHRAGGATERRRYRHLIHDTQHSGSDIDI